MNSLERWRLILGRFAEHHLKTPLSPREARMEAALDFLYSREYQGRGIRERSSAGTLDPTRLNVPRWLEEVRELFPRDVVEIIEKHAIARYGMTDLLTDKETLEKLEPNMDLVKTLMSFRGHLGSGVLDTVRRIIRAVVDDLRHRLEPEIRRALTGRLNRHRHSSHAAAQNFDWRRTIRRSLRHYDPDRKALRSVDPSFYARNTRLLPWQVILCVDQSGSMAESVIHTAVVAGVLASMPAMRVKMVLFDTAIVDVSDRVDDPVELLLSVQLGGGTDIGQALEYCAGLIENPHRTVLVLVSDFCEGASSLVMLRACRRLREDGVILLGLASLDQSATPVYDRAMADQLAEQGMDIAALTPRHFAEWLAKILNSR